MSNGVSSDSVIRFFWIYAAFTIGCRLCIDDMGNKKIPKLYEY